MVMGMAITIMPSYSGKPGHITIMLLAAALLPGMQGGGGVTVRGGGAGAGRGQYTTAPRLLSRRCKISLKIQTEAGPEGEGGGQDTGA